MDHRIIRYPPSRLSVIDLGKLGASRHAMYCLLELDVTDARAMLRRSRREGKSVSFTAWLTAVIGRCVADHGPVHAVAFRKNSVVSFSDVDVSILVEREVDGTAVPLPCLVRAANRKSAEEIDREIRDAVSQPLRDEGDAVLGRETLPPWMFRFYYAMPHALRVFLLRRLTASPFRLKALSGTVTLTTVGAAGGSGWILPTRSWHNALFALGTVSRKPWVAEGEVRIREILNMTVMMNHDVIDGSPARRFVQDLARRVEKAEPSSL